MQRLPQTFAQPGSIYQQDIQIRRELEPTFTGDAVICIVMLGRGRSTASRQVAGRESVGRERAFWESVRCGSQSPSAKNRRFPECAGEVRFLALYEFADRLQKFSP